MNKVLENIYQTLIDIKAQNITTFDTRRLTDQYDYIFITTATSTRHAKSIANHICRSINKTKKQEIAVEGLPAAEWILAKYENIIIHIMLEETRHYYKLEELWGDTPITI